MLGIFDFMQGILLSGGSGTRLAPVTVATSKQLLPVYDKPLVYYPLCTLLLSGVRNIIVIVNPEHFGAYNQLLGNGEQWGIEIKIIEQEKPTGIPDAFKVGKKHLDDSRPCVLALGDNLIYGHGAGQNLFANLSLEDANIFGYEVQNAQEFGIAEIDADGSIKNIVEKPTGRKSGIAIPGLYRFPSSIFQIVQHLRPSQRGETEIVDVLNIFRLQNKLKMQILPRGVTWLDTGTPDGLLSASNFVSTIQNRQGFLVGSPEEVSWRMGYVNDMQFENLVVNMPKSDYQLALIRLMAK